MRQFTFYLTCRKRLEIEIPKIRKRHRYRFTRFNGRRWCERLRRWMENIWCDSINDFFLDSALRRFFTYVTFLWFSTPPALVIRVTTGIWFTYDNFIRRIFDFNAMGRNLLPGSVARLAHVPAQSKKKCTQFKIIQERVRTWWI